MPLMATVMLIDIFEECLHQVFICLTDETSAAVMEQIEGMTVKKLQCACHWRAAAMSNLPKDIVAQSRQAVWRLFTTRAGQYKEVCCTM